jgi:uncharacterized protein (UPF0303 family)
MKLNDNNFDKQLKELELEHEQLVFNEFTNETALELGLMLIAKAKEKKAEIAINITKNGHQLFHYALANTAPENERWIQRKNNIVNHFFKSSYYVSIFLKSKNTTLEELYNLDSKVYAPYGGAFPLSVKNVGVVGTITVSGLPDYEDHQLVVQAIKEYLKE